MSGASTSTALAGDLRWMHNLVRRDEDANELFRHPLLIEWQGERRSLVTDGRVLLMVDRIGPFRFLPTADSGPLYRVIDQHRPTSLGTTTIAALREWAGPVPEICERCYGSEAVRCDKCGTGDALPCAECVHGYPQVRAPFGPAHVDTNILARLIERLGDGRAAVAFGKQYAAIRFDGDGWCALLMPMRAPGDPNVDVQPQVERNDAFDGWTSAPAEVAR